MNLKQLLIGIVTIASLAACQKADPYMTLSQKNLQVGEEGGKVSLAVSANTYYRVNNDMDWAELSIESVVGETTTFSITVSANPKTERRTGTIRFIGDGVTPLKFKLVQDAKIPVGVTPELIDVAYNETSTSFTVLGIDPWTASCDNADFVLSATEGTGETPVQVTFPENKTDEPVQANVTVVSNGKTYTCQITQGAAPTGVSPETINVAFSETAASFTVLTSKSWTASSDNADFKLSAASGTGETTVNVTFPANELEQEVTATITVTINGENYTCQIIQAAAPSKEKIDLSASGTSNCYIVSKGGYYKFKATVRGTGIIPESCAAELTASIAPAKASVLWSTYNTATAPASQNDIITELSLDGEYVLFQTANMTKPVSGNVIIAVYDASDVILWSWHIWVTEEPAANNIGGAMWMDRNLGAVNNVRGDAGSCGLLYQWGRKDPMRGTSSFDTGDFIATLPEPTGTEIEVPVNETNGTIAASIKNPRAFINTYPGGSGPKDWIFTADHLDRWNDTQKTALDPCPQGYRVPTSAQMQAFGAAGGLPTGSTKYSANADAKAAFNQADHVFETAAWSLPIAGYIAYNAGTVLTDVNVCAKYETSTKSAKAASSYYFNANTSACNFTNEATSGHAGSLRCVKE